MDIDNTRRGLRNFILENYLFTNDQSELKDSDSFLDSGTLDSMGILELVDYLDKSLNIKVEGDELTPDNLDSIDRLVDFVRRKCAA